MTIKIHTCVCCDQPEVYEGLCESCIAGGPAYEAAFNPQREPRCEDCGDKIFAADQRCWETGLYCVPEKLEREASS